MRTHTQRNVSRIHSALFYDRALRLRYDWSHKYAPNRIRVVVRRVLKRKKKKIKKNEAAHSAPRGEHRYPSFRLAFLRKISSRGSSSFDHRIETRTPAAAPARQMRGVAVLPFYFGQPFTRIFIVVLEFMIRYRRECACKGLLPFSLLSIALLLKMKSADDDERLKDRAFQNWCF